MTHNKGRTCSVNRCESEARCRGWCNLHYKRWIHTGDPEVTLITAKGQRLETLLKLMAVETDDCILWPYTPTSGGYGAVTINNQSVATHVYVCAERHGPKPEQTMQAAHRCGVSLCVNPRHLRWATPKENSADMVQHGTRLRGDTHPRSKIDEADRAIILARWAAGESLSSLSREWDIERGSIRGWAKRSVAVS